MRILICITGESRDPVVAAIRAHRPDHVVLVAPAVTPPPADALLAAAHSQASSEVILLTDGHNLARCVHNLRAAIAGHEDWMAAAHEGRLLADFAGGSRMLAVALALAFSRMPLRFAYPAAVGDRSGAHAGRDAPDHVYIQPNPLL